MRRLSNEEQLANGGERIRLDAIGGIVIRDFVYGDQHPWSESPDGDGASLVLVSPASDPDHSLATNSRPSTAAGGNPGGSDATTFPGGDLAAYALARGSPAVSFDATGHFVYSYPRNLAADDITYSVLVSDDLVSWVEDPAQIAFSSMRDNGDGTATMNYRATNHPLAIPRLFARLLLIKHDE